MAKASITREFPSPPPPKVAKITLELNAEEAAVLSVILGSICGVSLRDVVNEISEALHSSIPASYSVRADDDSLSAYDSSGVSGCIIFSDVKSPIWNQYVQMINGGL